MNIFLDVGGHIGQTLEEVLKPIYRFDAVHCFEPQADCYTIIKNKFRDSRLVVHDFGLADFDGMKNLYGKGVGASIFSDKDDTDDSIYTSCRFIRASSFVTDNIKEGDTAIMKLNCEGSEALILRDLLASDQIHLLSNVMIDFDIRKIPSMRKEEKKIKTELRNQKFNNYTTQRQSMVGSTHQTRICFWLSSLPNADEFMELTAKQKKMRNFPFWARRFMSKFILKTKALLPDFS